MWVFWVNGFSDCILGCLYISGSLMLANGLFRTNDQLCYLSHDMSNVMIQLLIDL